MKKRISLILALSLLLTLSVPAAAANDAVGTTLRLTETKGTVTVKTAAGKSKSVVKSMRLYNGYTVGTGASSSAYIGLDDTKAVQLDASGLVEIKKQGKKLEVSLTSGQLYFNVTEPLKTNESLNVRTATMVTGIRGSFGWVNGDQMGLLHGHVTLSCINPETGETRTIDVHSGEMVSYDQASSQSAESSLQEVGFVKEAITVEAVPAIVVEAVKNDETLQRQLTEDVESIDVTELIDSLEAKQAEEKAAEEAAQAQVEEAVAAQETSIAEEAAAEQASGTSSGTAQEYAFETPAPAPAGNDSGDDTPTAYTVTDATQLGAALSANNDVTFTGTGTASGIMTIQSGKTLTVASGANLTIDSGKTLTINDGASLTVANGATLTLNGTVNNLSDHTLTNNGTVIINGTFCNGGATAGRFVNKRTITFGDSGRLINKANGTLVGDGFNMPNVFYTVSYNTNGGTEIAAKELAVGAAVSAEDLTRAGYSFDGWYTDSDFKTAVTEKTVMPDANLTLYAKWLEVSTVFVSEVTTVTEGAATSTLVRYTKLNGTTNTAAYSGTEDGGSSLVGWYKIEIDSSGSSTLIKTLTPLTNQASESRTGNISSSSGTFTITGGEGTTATCSCDADTKLIVGKLVTGSAAGETATTTTLHTRISTGVITPDASSSLEDKNVFYVYSGTKVLYVFALGTDSTVGSGTSGILYVQSVTTDGSSVTSVTGQMDGGTAATYTGESSIISKFAADSLYPVNYDLGTIKAVDTSLSSAPVSQVYSSNSKTLHVNGVAYTIDDGARFYNIVRKSADDIGEVTLVSGWPDLNDGTIVYIVTATGGENLATAVYYVSDD